MSDEVVMRSIVNVLYLSAAAFLCFFTVREKLRLRLPIIVGAVAITGIAYIGAFYNFGIDTMGVYPLIAQYIYLAAALVFYLFAVNENKGKLSFIFLLSANYLLLIDAIGFTARYAFDLSWPMENALAAGITIVTLPLAAWLLRTKYWPVLRGMGGAEVRILLPLGIVVLVFVTLTENLLLARIEESIVLAVIGVLLMAIAFGSYYLMLFSLRSVTERLRQEEQLRFMESQLETQRGHYREIESRVLEVRTLRHDMRHHLAAVKGLLSEQKYFEANAYLGEYEAAAEPTDTPLCGSMILDVIARRYKARAEALDIGTEFRLGIPADCGVADTDLCIVLGNLLENALAACTAQTEGKAFLRVLAETTSQDVFLSVLNSCEKEHESTGQGLGLSSVEAVAKKYKGFTKFDREDGTFSASVLMYRV